MFGDKKLMAEEKLAKTGDLEEKKKGRNHSEKKNEEEGKGEWKWFS